MGVISHTGKYFLSLFWLHVSSGRFPWTGLFFHSSFFRDSLTKHARPVNENETSDAFIWSPAACLVLFHDAFITFPMT